MRRVRGAPTVVWLLGGEHQSDPIYFQFRRLTQCAAHRQSIDNWLKALLILKFDLPDPSLKSNADYLSVSELFSCPPSSRHCSNCSSNRRNDVLCGTRSTRPAQSEQCLQILFRRSDSYLGHRAASALVLPFYYGWPIIRAKVRKPLFFGALWISLWTNGAPERHFTIASHSVPDRQCFGTAALTKSSSSRSRMHSSNRLLSGLQTSIQLEDKQCVFAFYKISKGLRSF